MLVTSKTLPDHSVFCKSKHGRAHRLQRRGDNLSFSQPVEISEAERWVSRHKLGDKVQVFGVMSYIRKYADFIVSYV